MAGVGERQAHVDLRGEVEDRLRARRGDDRLERLRVAHVAALQHGAVLERAGEVALAAAGEVVDDRHLVAALEQRVDEVRSDEAGSAGDEGTHAAADYGTGPRPAGL